MNLEWVLNDFMYWCLQKGRAHLEGELKATSARDSGDPGAQACHNNLFEDDVVIWSAALGLVVPVVTYNDSGFLIYTPELQKLPFWGSWGQMGKEGRTHGTWNKSSMFSLCLLAQTSCHAAIACSRGLGRTSERTGRERGQGLRYPWRCPSLCKHEL